MSLALAVLLPVAVIALGLSALERVRTADDLTQEANVGVVLNGRQLRRPLVEAVDELLARAAPEVVVLGNSIANTDFAVAAFAAETRIDPRRIAKLSIPNTMAAHWYAILKNRVYANGHAPRLVIVVSDLQSLLAVTPRSEASHVALTLQLGDREPVIDGKLGRRVWALERVRENRTVARDRLVSWTRNRLVDLLVHRSVRPLDARPTDEALARVFADERTDNRRHKRVIPIFHVTSPFEVTFEEDDLAEVRDGFVPDLLGLVEAHGGTFVFVRPPMSPRLPAGYGDVVPAPLEAEVPRAFASAGHVYLDLRAIPMQASHFQNLDHMNDEGARRFTWVLTDALRESGVGLPLPPGIDLLKSFVLEDGVLAPRPPRVGFAEPPPQVPGGRQEIRDGRGRSGWFPAGAFGWLADVATLAVSPHGARCSPIRVLEGPPPERPEAGPTLLGPANVTCDELFRLGAGRTCHTPDRVYFTASDGTDPWDNGRAYTLVLDPARGCPESRWSYPKDAFRVDVPPGPGVAVQLIARAADVGSTGRGGSPTVIVEVRRGAEVLTRGEVPLDELTGTVTFPLAAPAEGLSVHVDNRSDHFLLWEQLHVRTAPAGG